MIFPAGLAASPECTNTPATHADGVEPKPSAMKNPVSILFLSLAPAASLPAVTITVANNVPNGINSGGSGSAAGLLTTTLGSISSNRGLPVTTYTVSGVDLTSVGGTNNENFTFTVGYSATGGAVGFSGFGNVGVGGDFLVSGSESLTATITLTSSSFANLSLTGFTYVRAGGFGAGETGTFTWAGGSHNIGPLTGTTIANGINGSGATAATLTSGLTQAPLTPGGNSTLNFEGFGAEFVAIPEPASASLLALGAAALLRRRRSA